MSAPRRSTTPGEQPTHLHLTGPVTDRDATRIDHALTGVLHRHHLDGVDTRVRVTALPGPDRPLLVQAVLGPGYAIRTQIAAPADFAARVAARRLDTHLTRQSGPALRPWPDAARPPLAHTGPTRPITRHKRYRLLTGSPGLAAYRMDALDYDALLFTDTDTGDDALVYRAGPHRVRLARAHLLHPPHQTAVAMTMNPHPTPIFTDTEAARRLCRYGLPLLFYTGPADTRARLLYRRYDGDLGLVTAAG
ncbi:sigma 54 modulation/S30EA ribosomal C-terminal domain-containing protein [Nocardia terpenica]|uniref:sigma 54 modulation/S30EA ribosomal C-terminal domain-containing protein n=1 Tax=Nocardia terpenica TaxID=455432 RepID=UPI0015C54201|nr:sigma 54 modulation/S30EA ribosomal C-terminal domain-containing protein [Nocardia terpenica]NQE92330.1 hypothetical protein [Nocardia terpenica]